MKTRTIGLVAVGLGLVVLILWFGGFLATGKIGPGDAVTTTAAQAEPPATAKASLESVTDWYEAVGTVRPKTETRIEAQVTAKVLKVHVRPGSKAAQGDLLITLDARELASRLEEARQALSSAQAMRAQAVQSVNAARADFTKAEAQHKRIAALFADKAVTQRELDQAEAEYLQAEAGLKRAADGIDAADAAERQARKVVEQARIALGYSEIRAHEDMDVMERATEPGDLAFPGKTLLVVRTGGTLRLEALVREGLIEKIHPGETFDVALTAISRPLKGVIEEVVPSADPATRTFTVKASLPATPGLYPGMFGRLLVPLGQRQTVVVPADAVRRVGQLETVRVHDGALWRQVYVTTGPERNGMVEILSGLAGGEEVALEAAHE